MTTETKTVQLISEGGNDVQITVAYTHGSYDYSADGDMVELSHRDHFIGVRSMTINGQMVSGSYGTTPCVRNGVSFAGRYGHALLTPANVSLIEAALDDFRARPEYVAYVARQAAAAAEVDEYEAGLDMINRAMGNR